VSRRAPSDNREVDLRVVGWMRRAVALATGAQPHPNPRVGAIVLDPGGDEIGAGHHEGPGSPHAEVVALGAAANTVGSTVVVTLEPCSHHGATPPCSEALINAGVSRVIVGVVDPDERVAGAGIARLRRAGIAVEVLDSPEARDLDRAYLHHRGTGRPRFRLKLAATLDGQAAARDGTSQWITSEDARADAHELRATADAVVVGAGTLRADDPLLDVRIAGWNGRQPRPVLIAGHKPLPPARRVYARQPLIFAPEPIAVPDGADLIVASGPSGVDLTAVAKELSDRGLIEVLIDGGPTLATAFLEAGLADELTFYFGASLAGGPGAAMFTSPFETLATSRDLEIVSVAKVGPDVRVDAFVGGV